MPQGDPEVQRERPARRCRRLPGELAAHSGLVLLLACAACSDTDGGGPVDCDRLPLVSREGPPPECVAPEYEDLVGDTRDTAAVMSLGDTYSERLSSTDDVDVYRFEVREARLVRVEVAGDIWPDCRLWNARSESFRLAGSHCNADDLPLCAGTYFVEVWNSWGPYTLSIRGLDATVPPDDHAEGRGPATALTADGELEGEIECLFDRDSFVVAFESDSYLRFRDLFEEIADDLVWDELTQWALIRCPVRDDLGLQLDDGTPCDFEAVVAPGAYHFELNSAGRPGRYRLDFETDSPRCISADVS